MTLAETAKLVAVAVSCFPSLQERDMKATTTGWHQIMHHLPFELAQAALTKVLATSHFFPTPAQVLAAAATLQPQSLPDPEAAWQEVLIQISHVGYTGTPAWSHPAVGKAAEALYGGWVNLCQSLMVDTLGVDRAHFMRLYESFSRQERENRILPPAVVQLAEKLVRSIKAREGGDQA